LAKRKHLCAVREGAALNMDEGAVICELHRKQYVFVERRLC
jgi:hypothetical protein